MDVDIVQTITFAAGNNELFSFAIQFACIFLVTHCFFEFFSARTPVYKALEETQVRVPVRTKQQRRPQGKSLSFGKVAVTGGAGFLGTEVVRQLQSAGFEVIVIDCRIPSHPSFREKNVSYYQLDLLGKDSSSKLQQLFRDCVAVCHTAGVVCLADDPGLLFNVHVVATQVVLRAARLAGVKAFVQTSSTGAITSPYISSNQQQNIPSNFQVPQDWKFFSHYSKTKYKAEHIVLRCNEAAFKTCSLRLPGMYGVGDRMIVDLLVDGTMTFVPGGDDDTKIPIDFVYVKNAAHAHVLATLSLLGIPRMMAFQLSPDVSDDYEIEETAQNLARIQHKVAGRIFNVSNGEPIDAKDMWDTFLATLHTAVGRFNAPRQLFRMPYVIVIMLASVSEFLFWFFAGRVPFRQSPFWNLTRSTADLTQVSITLDITDSRTVLGYEPLYNNKASFQDIVADLKQQKQTSSLTVARELDWAPRPLPRQFVSKVFSYLAGPGMTGAELIVVGCSAVLGICFVLNEANTKTGTPWTSIQIGTALVFALVNMSAAVQCTTATSKRWYHAGRKLTTKLLIFMIVEVVLQIYILATVFDTSTNKKTSNHFTGLNDALVYTVHTSTVLVASMIIVHNSDLHIQRPMSIFTFCCVLCWWHGMDTMEKGMQWAVPVLALKYLVSHIPRHEPYS